MPQMVIARSNASLALDPTAVVDGVPCGPPAIASVLLANYLASIALASGNSLNIDKTLVTERISRNESVVATERTTFRGFFAFPVKLMEGIDTFSAAGPELVIMQDSRI
jgi:hypothetical protein